ncbi:MAG: hypothetical protein FJ316_05230 [SAR202 cluster bacterium]|nr:hypothetical protein [SAR202 cluster bacterium]
MPEVTNAEQATAVAVAFLKSYYPISQKPLSARFQKGRVVAEDAWVIEVDVGAFYPRIATVTVNARTGTIPHYEVERSEALPPSPGAAA